MILQGTFCYVGNPRCDTVIARVVLPLTSADSDQIFRNYISQLSSSFNVYFSSSGFANILNINILYVNTNCGVRKRLKMQKYI